MWSKSFHRLTKEMWLSGRKLTSHKICFRGKKCGVWMSKNSCTQRSTVTAVLFFWFKYIGLASRLLTNAVPRHFVGCIYKILCYNSFVDFPFMLFFWKAKPIQAKLVYYYFPTLILLTTHHFKVYAVRSFVYCDTLTI